VYGLASAMPSAIHLTVPRSFTGTRPGIWLHHQDLGPAERWLWDDVPVTAVERTLVDLARAGEAAGRLAAGILYPLVPDSVRAA
jgi:hypothetical protein